MDYENAIKTSDLISDLLTKKVYLTKEKYNNLFYTSTPKFIRNIIDETTGSNKEEIKQYIPDARYKLFIRHNQNMTC